jgi:hypothetical protein
MLTHIVRITGEIPYFVKAEKPRCRAIAKLRLQLAAAIKLGDQAALQQFPQAQQMQMANRPQQVWMSDLLSADPYTVVKLAVQPRPTDHPKVNPKYFNPLLPPEILRLTARQSSDLDPLLYLAIVTDLTGKNPEQDDQIATLVRRWQPGSDTRNGLQDILAGHRVAGDQARRFLDKMVIKAKTPALVDAMRDLTATLLPPKR